VLKDVLETRFTAKWWDAKPVEADKLQYVLDCAYLAPSKQGRHDHTILVVTDSPEGLAFKDWLYYENTYCINGIRGLDGPGFKRFNGQVRAPIVLLWIADVFPDGKNSKNEIENQRVRDDSIVSATIAMCAAEEVGLASGFNGCIGNIEAAEYLGLTDKIISMAIGIGYAAPDRSRIIRETYEGEVRPIAYPNNNPKAFPNAYQLLMQNKEFIVEESCAYLAWQVNTSKTYKGYQYSEAKCRRDLSYVIDAMLHDIQHNTTAACQTMISEYWARGVPQVRRVVEPLVYSFIRGLVRDYIMKNIAYPNPKQLIAAQYINSALVPEATSAAKINGFVVLIANGIRTGNKKLTAIGNDYSNVDPNIVSAPNRKNKPPKEVMINYI
jgi:hypothetical protein